MTKHVRIENADTSDHKVKVFIEERSNTGEWIRGEQEPMPLSYPTAMTTLMIHSGRRLVVEEG